jgi:hypothetical protein
MFKRLGQLAKRRLGPAAQEAPESPAPVYVWSIGIYSGATCLEFAPPEALANPVLTRESIRDLSAGFVADPFMISVDGTWYMFFEIMDAQTGKGVIGLASSQNGTDWVYHQVVLAEPFHLSYPYVFEHMGDYYMIPECHESRTVRLYRAWEFPSRWSLAGTLLAGGVFLDPSIVRYANRWWLFAETNPLFRYDTLRLYSAPALTGPWSEHPASPIVRRDPYSARPAGRVVLSGETLVRYAQNCSAAYGTDVRAFEVTELTSSRYRERPAGVQPILGPTGKGWNGCGMHHLDPHRVGERAWVACVDGWFATPV